MFRHRQPLRRWAALALLLWLFGLGVGVAHACLAPGQGPERSAPQAAAVDACHGADHAHDGAPGKTNCQDFCDKAGVSIRPLKAALDDLPGAAPLLPTAAAVLTFPALAPVQPRVPRRDGVRAPPIPIAFLRLTL